MIVKKTKNPLQEICDLLDLKDVEEITIKLAKDSLLIIEAKMFLKTDTCDEIQLIIKKIIMKNV